VGRLLSHLFALGALGSLGYLNWRYSAGKSELGVVEKSFVSMNVLIIIFFVLLEYLKSKAFSGLPYLNEDKKRRSKAIKNRILLFLFGKILDIGVGGFLLLNSTSQDVDFEEWVGCNTLKGFILYMVQGFLILVCEVYPIYKCTQRRFIRFMERDGSHHGIQLFVENQSKVRTFFASSLNSSSSSKEISPSKDGRFLLATAEHITMDKLGLNVVVYCHQGQDYGPTSRAGVYLSWQVLLWPDKQPHVRQAPH
jgi:hypothetical protein